jgi:hypothetical protein
VLLEQFYHVLDPGWPGVEGQHIGSLLNSFILFGFFLHVSL